MQLLARRKFFAAGKRFSGLSARELGVDVLYKGAGRFARSQVVYSDHAAAAVVGSVGESDSAPPGAAGNDARSDSRRDVPDIPDEEWASMTIAERRKAREDRRQAQERSLTEGADR